MTSSTLPPQVLGQRTQFSTLELGVGASLAAMAVLGVTLFATANNPADTTSGSTRNAPTSEVSAVPAP